jgi:hypothetical protein
VFNRHQENTAGRVYTVRMMLSSCSSGGALRQLQILDELPGCLPGCQCSGLIIFGSILKQGVKMKQRAAAF